MSVMYIRNEQTGEFEPVPSLVGPQGPPGANGGGAGTVTSVNKVVPDATGNVTLTAADVGALPSDGTAVNATQLNGKSASEYALKTDLPTKASDIGALPSDGTAADSYKLDGKDSVYYHKKFSHPRNLLDNSDFRNPVNQRGETTYYGAGDRDVYTIDRWLFSWQAGAVLTVGKGYIQKNNLPLIQRLKNIDLNKTYTLALCFANGDKRVYSGTFANHFGDFDNFIWGGMAGDVPQVRIAPPVVDPLAWTALYEGEYTADNLPPYVPKGYAAELAECSRWYTCGTLQTARPFAMGSNTMAYLCDVKYPVPMEVEHLPAKQPTVNISNVKIWVDQSDAGVSAVKNIGDNTGFNSVNLSAGLSDAVIQFDYEASADL